MKVKDIVIIDDDSMSIFITLSLIKKCTHEYKIHTFESPSEGVEFLSETYTREDIPTSILIDINMPEMDGWEVIRRLEKKYDHLNIVVLTSSMHPDDLQRAQRFKSVKRFLHKPVSIDDIKEVIIL